MPQPRVFFPELPNATILAHNEEHIVVETTAAARLVPGTLLQALPWHICPTVALHDFVHVVHHGAATETLPVTARTRRISC
jgi:D-serine deaminase-like pyridoxal phosphate-dependent protein